MRKTILAGFTALALVAPSLGFAQQQPQDAQGEQHHPRFTQEDMKAFTDARIAGLKAGLELTPDQEKNWAPVEQAIRDMAQARAARMAQRRERGRDEDAIAKLRERADAMTKRAEELRKLAGAAEPLYKTLTDDQKKRLRIMVRMTMQNHGWRHQHGWDRG